MQERIQRGLRDEGVTIVSGFNTYIEAGVTIGPDTVSSRSRSSAGRARSARIA